MGSQPNYYLSGKQKSCELSNLETAVQATSCCDDFLFLAFSLRFPIHIYGLLSSEDCSASIAWVDMFVLPVYLFFLHDFSNSKQHTRRSLRGPQHTPFNLRTARFWWRLSHLPPFIFSDKPPFLAIPSSSENFFHKFAPTKMCYSKASAFHNQAWGVVPRFSWFLGGRRISGASSLTGNAAFPTISGRSGALCMFVAFCLSDNGVSETAPVWCLLAVLYSYSRTLSRKHLHMFLKKQRFREVAGEMSL